MKPVTVEDAREALRHKSILVLNTGLLSIHTFAQKFHLEARSGAFQKLFGLLPPELWYQIIELVVDATLCKKEKHCFVQGKKLEVIKIPSACLRKDEGKAVSAIFLECIRVDMPRVAPAREFSATQRATWYYEEFLRHPSHKLSRAGGPTAGWGNKRRTVVERVVGSDGTVEEFRILLALTDSNGGNVAFPTSMGLKAPILFDNVSIVDVNAFVQGGKCSACRRLRILRPIDRVYTRRLGCLWCMGIPFCNQLQDLVSDPRKTREEVKEWVRERLHELGYLNKTVELNLSRVLR